ncbi:MAG: hypothetical protein JW839_02520 [Candidatus Lokiarchaeota archaeon]|nr:hypothetical protein [Candidatus Lokiarchaeota archaeon]
MAIKKGWFFKCRYDKRAEAYLLENSDGMLAGSIRVELDQRGMSSFVMNSRHEVALVLEATSDRDQHCRILVPRRAALDGEGGLAIFGIVNRKADGFDYAYEYESAIGSDIMQIMVEGFPRRLIIRRGGISIAEIEKNSREIKASVIDEARDREVLLVIGIMAAICLLMPVQAAFDHATSAPAVLIN